MAPSLARRNKNLEEIAPGPTAVAMPSSAGTQEPRELVDAVVHQSDTAVPSSSGSAAAVVVPPTVPDSAGGFVCILCARGFKSEEMLKE